MHRFYLPPDQCRGEKLLLTGFEAHHALHVMRVRLGERILILNGEGHQFVCEVVQPGRDWIELKVLERTSSSPPACRITLLQALPRGKLIESIIQKATELGIWRVVPLLAERTVMHLATEDRKQKSQKWQSVAIEAIKQCGSNWLTQIEMPLRVRDFLQRAESFELGFVGSLQERRRHPRQYFEIFRREHGRNPESACVWIGPEGDFTPEELTAIEAAGALPISLGPLVLRTETAAIYSLSILNYELSAPSTI